MFSGRKYSAFSHADLVVSLALLLFGSTFVFAAARQMNEIDARKQCASNLRQIGQAILLYSNENKGAFPRTIFKKQDAPSMPVWGTPYEQNKDLKAFENADPFAADNLPESPYRPEPNDVTAALYLLMRTQDITTAVFSCPSTSQSPWVFGGGTNTALSWTNWKGVQQLAKSLSYSYQNPYPSAGAMREGFRLNNAIPTEFAVASDLNPGVDALLKVKLDAKNQQSLINSPNHRGAGQNVLFGDGHIEFLATPYVGVNGDNIFTFGHSGPKQNGATGDGIVGSPADANDSILLPTAKDLGIPTERPKPATAPSIP